MPTISEADETLIAAQDMLAAYKTLLSERTTKKVKHNRTIEKIIGILNNATTASEKRQLVRPATSSETTAPHQVRYVKHAKCINNTLATIHRCLKYSLLSNQ